MSTQTSPTPHLDHIVLLLPHSSLLSPPKWLTRNFTLSPGGRHGDGKTENKLIAFKDGTYIELIAFVDDNPEAMNGHWWDPREKGWGVVDYAFGFDGEGAEVYEASVVPRLNALNPDHDNNGSGDLVKVPPEWIPQPLRPGSRTKPDGSRLEWRVAFPAAGARGAAPFWCFDVTPRERRVPGGEDAVRHPCGAVGVAGLSIVVEGEERRGPLGRLLEASGARRMRGSGDGGRDGYEVAVPKKVVGKGEAHEGCRIEIVEPRDKSEETGLRKGRKLVARVEFKVEEGKRAGHEMWFQVGPDGAGDDEDEWMKGRDGDWDWVTFGFAEA